MCSILRILHGGGGLRKSRSVQSKEWKIPRHVAIRNKSQKVTKIEGDKNPKSLKNCPFDLRNATAGESKVSENTGTWISLCRLKFLISNGTPSSVFKVSEGIARHADSITICNNDPTLTIKISCTFQFLESLLSIWCRWWDEIGLADGKLFTRNRCKNIVSQSFFFLRVL